MENSADSQIRRCACVALAGVADGSQSMSVACALLRNMRPADARVWRAMRTMRVMTGWGQG
ncbi:hypothetical protein AU476_20075 [Cupriavidus sp. UYMSc13B]|nr:hypothetical protein AU476_20075 [Cupriavidus sp. UYMSc13B]